MEQELIIDSIQDTLNLENVCFQPRILMTETEKNLYIWLQIFVCVAWVSTALLFLSAIYTIMEHIIEFVVGAVRFVIRLNLYLFMSMVQCCHPQRRDIARQQRRRFNQIFGLADSIFMEKESSDEEEAVVYGYDNII